MRSDPAVDIVVVGGGAAGCVVAARLAAVTPATIRLLEAGPDLRGRVPAGFRDGWGLPTGHDWGYRTEPDTDGSTEPLRRMRLLGGSSWFARFAVRGSPADFDGWAAAGLDGWSFDEVLPVFTRIETDAEAGEAAWHGDRGPIPITRYPARRPGEIHAATVEALRGSGFEDVPDVNAPGAVGVGRMPMSSRDGLRVTTCDAYLPDGAMQPNLTISADSPVADVVIDGGRARGVRLVDGTVIAAGRVVLCAGVYGSPTILMRSGIGPAPHLRSLGIEVRLDLPGVGSNLADHPGVDLETGWRGDATRGPVLHSMATTRTLRALSAAPDLMFWMSDPDGEAPRFYLDPILLKPRSRGTVRLRSTDPDDPPIIDLPGLREAIDVERLAEGYRLAIDVANRPEVRALCPEPQPTVPSSRSALRALILENAYSIPHTVGTCAMGSSPDDGAVVDATGAVHGIDGLSIVDASIIPDAPSGFPHLITIMIAERLAEVIADQG